MILTPPQAFTTSPSLRSCGTSGIPTPQNVPPGPIDEDFLDSLLDPSEVVRQHRLEPDRVSELLRFDADDDLPGLIDQGVPVGAAEDV
jgi:hypothetical protein